MLEEVKVCGKMWKGVMKNRECVGFCYQGHERIDARHYFHIQLLKRFIGNAPKDEANST